MPITTEQDYYEVLGIQATATADEVKRAFRTQMMKYHPDIYRGPNAHEKAVLLNKIWETLADPAKRARYDRWRPIPGSTVPSTTAAPRSYGGGTPRAAAYEAPRYQYIRNIGKKSVKTFYITPALHEWLFRYEYSTAPKSHGHWAFQTVLAEYQYKYPWYVYKLDRAQAVYLKHRLEDFHRPTWRSMEANDQATKQFRRLATRLLETTRRIRLEIFDWGVYS